MIIKSKDFESLVELNGTQTAALIKEALPFDARAEVWQEEVYFTIPVDTSQEKGTPQVERGDVAYWPPGKALCIFFGDTQPVSEVTIVGKVVRDLELFAGLNEGDGLKLTE